jgi:hypothetical protein
MRDAIRMVLLVKRDGHLGPPESHWGGESVDDILLLLGDPALPVGFVRLGALKDHEAALGLGELIVFLLGTVCWVTGLRGRLLGLALLAEGATDVALHGGTVLEKMLCVPLVEQAGQLEHLLKVFRSWSTPVGLRFGGAVRYSDHLLPAVSLVLVSPITASLR